MTEDPAVQIIADVFHGIICTQNPGHRDWTDCAKSGPCYEDAVAATAGLRAAGYPLDPDEVSVPIEALKRLVFASADVGQRKAVPAAMRDYIDAVAICRARLDPSTKETR